MYCKNCGNQITENSKFCSHCGTAVEIMQPEEVDTQKPDNPETIAQKEKGCTSNLLFIICAPFFILVAVIIWMNSVSGDKLAVAASASSTSSIAVSSVSASSSTIFSSASSELATSSQMSEEKAYAIEFDEFIMNTILGSNEALEELDNYINAYSVNKISALEAYDAAKNTKELMTALNKAILSTRNNRNGTYIGAAQAFNTNGRFKAENMMKYLDKNEVKYLSEMKQNDLSIYNSFKKLMLERVNFLKSQGLSDTEINEIIQKTPSSTSSK